LRHARVLAMRHNPGSAWPLVGIDMKG